MRTTVIRKVKQPEGFGRWPAYVVGEDGYGLWLFSPKGTIFRGQLGVTIEECEVGQGSRDAGMPVMHLIPDTGWWMAQWSSDGVISVEVCTPPMFVDGEWRFVDLELDPVAFADGRVEVHDEDEFAAACEAGLIPATEAVVARAAADDLERRLRERVEPFGRVGWGRLDEAIRSALPALMELPDVPSA